MNENRSSEVHGECMPHSKRRESLRHIKAQPTALCPLLLHAPAPQPQIALALKTLHFFQSFPLPCCPWLWTSLCTREASIFRQSLGYSSVAECRPYCVKPWAGQTLDTAHITRCELHKTSPGPTDTETRSLQVLLKNPGGDPGYLKMNKGEVERIKVFPKTCNVPN